MVEAELIDLERMMAEGASWHSPPEVGYSEMRTADGELQAARYDALRLDESRNVARILKLALQPGARLGHGVGWKAVVKPARVNRSERSTGAAREFAERWRRARAWVAGREWGSFADEGIEGGACYRTGHMGKVDRPEPHDGHWRRQGNPFNITREGLLNYKLLAPFRRVCREVVLPKLSDIVFAHDPDLWKRLTEVWVWRRVRYRALYAAWPDADYGPISSTCAIHTGGAYLPHVDINDHPELLNFIVPLRGDRAGWTGCDLLATASRARIPLNGQQILWFNSTNIRHCSAPMTTGHPNSRPTLIFFYDRHSVPYVEELNDPDWAPTGSNSTPIKLRERLGEAAILNQEKHEAELSLIYNKLLAPGDILRGLEALWREQGWAESGR